jgi:hypothetical protein
MVKIYLHNMELPDTQLVRELVVAWGQTLEQADKLELEEYLREISERWANA